MRRRIRIVALLSGEDDGRALRETGREETSHDGFQIITTVPGFGSEVACEWPRQLRVTAAEAGRCLPTAAAAAPSRQVPHASGARTSRGRPRLVHGIAFAVHMGQRSIDAVHVLWLDRGPDESNSMQLGRTEPDVGVNPKLAPGSA